MNHAIAGKPGDGKGLFSMRKIYADVHRSWRPIITDLAVEKLPWVTGDHKPRRGFHDYLMAKHHKLFEADERVFRLKPEAMTNFFLYRALNRQQVERLGSAHLQGYREVVPADNVLEESEWAFHKDYKLFVADHKSEVKKDGRVIVGEYDSRLSLASGGHLCIADEAWHKWPARGWNNTGPGILFYCSMVRRFGDDLWIQSQRFSDVDSILMDRMQDYWLCRNLGRLRRWIFKLPPIYSVSIFDHKPTPSSEPVHSQRFTLDKYGLAECYDTSGGVGVAGRVSADTEKKHTGVPMWVIPIIGVAAIIILIYLVTYGQRWVRNAFSPHHVKASKTVQTAAHFTSAPESQPSALPPVAPPAPVTNYCTGYCLIDGKPVAYLDDGSIVEPPALSLVASRFIVVDGVKLPIRQRTAVFVPPPDAPAFTGVVLPPSPVNNADVTYIGKARVHDAPRLNGIASMQSESPR